MSDLAAAVARADVAELLRVTDGLAATRDWPGLWELRDRCDAAVERGHQLWPISHHVEYRLALEAPGEWAARVLVDGAGRFAPGPLAEVAASTHAWAELAPHVAPGPLAALTLAECVVRGEDLREAPVPGPVVVELPARLEPWEPAYPLAEYHADHGEFPAPEAPRRVPVDLPAASAPVPDGPTCDALLALSATWTTQSDGRAETVAVSGTAEHAIAALGVPRARAAEIDAALALAWMAWAAASGGAHGRRRGMALGRYDAWWAATALAGFPPGEATPAELGEAVATLRWVLWDAHEPETGWTLRLAIEDPEHGLAWAVAAVDAS